MTDFERLKSIYVKTEKAEVLYKKLKGIWDNDHFVLGILIDLNTDEDKQKMLDAIEHGMVDTDEISMFAFELDKDYVEKWLTKELSNEYSRKLNDKLREVWDDDTFVYDVLRFLDSDEKKQKVIDAIDNGLRVPNEIDEYVDSLNEE